MVWFYVDDVLPFHERVIRAGNAAMGLWVRAGAWCSGQLTDGFVPADVARTMGSAAEVKKLVAVGLWAPEERDGQAGYLFHAWAEDGTGTKRQQTRAEVEEKRRKERERKAAYRARQDEQQDAPPPSGPRPPGVPAGQPRDVRRDSQGASADPYQSLPFPASGDYSDQSSYVPDREATTDDDGSSAARSAYWAGWKVSNPTRLIALIAQTVDRPVDERQAVTIVAGLLAKASRKQPVRNVEAYIEGALEKSWAEIQRDLDAAAVAA